AAAAMIVSPGRDSETAWPIVLHAVADDKQLSLSLPLTPFTYQVVLAQANGLSRHEVASSMTLRISCFITISLLWQPRRGSKTPKLGLRMSHHGTNFLASPFTTGASGVPLANVTDVKRNRASRMLSSHTISTVAVRITFPESSDSLKLAVPLQSEFTE